MDTDKLLELRRSLPAFQRAIFEFGEKVEDEIGLMELANKILEDSTINVAVPVPSTGGDSGN